MKLESISKIFGVLAFISFLLAIFRAVSGYECITRYDFVGVTIIFLLAAILTTLKRIASDIESSKKE